MCDVICDICVSDLFKTETQMSLTVLFTEKNEVIDIHNGNSFFVKCNY